MKRPSMKSLQITSVAAMVAADPNKRPTISLAKQHLGASCSISYLINLKKKELKSLLLVIHVWGKLLFYADWPECLFQPNMLEQGDRHLLCI